MQHRYINLLYLEDVSNASIQIHSDYEWCDNIFRTHVIAKNKNVILEM